MSYGFGGRLTLRERIEAAEDRLEDLQQAATKARAGILGGVTIESQAQWRKLGKMFREVKKQIGLTQKYLVDLRGRENRGGAA